MDTKVIGCIFICIVTIWSCSVRKHQEEIVEFRKPDCQFPLGPSTPVQSNKRIAVYKTKKDFSTNVPIILNETKDTIIGYPSPTDFSNIVNGKNVKKLEDDFLMDLVGVNKNSVFTSFEITRYKNQELPTLKNFRDNIIELHPFSELYYCNGNYNEVDLNRIIRNKSLSDSCLRVK